MRNLHELYCKYSDLEAMYMCAIILHASNPYHIVRKEFISQDKNISLIYEGTKLPSDCLSSSSCFSHISWDLTRFLRTAVPAHFKPTRRYRAPLLSRRSHRNRALAETWTADVLILRTIIGKRSVVFTPSYRMVIGPRPL